MHSSENADFALDPSALADFVIRDLTLGKDVVVLVDATYGTVALEYAAARLRGGRDQVLCVSAGIYGGLDCPALLRQLRQNVEQYGQGLTGSVQDDDISFLTAPNPGFERSVLLVANAEGLEHSALLMIQLACRASIRLRLVLAGQPSILTMLDHPELSTLEGRLLRGVRYSSATEDADGTGAVVVLGGRSRRMKVGFVVAAGVVLALSGMLTQWSWTQDDPSRPVSAQVATIPPVTSMHFSEQAVPAAGEVKVDPIPETLNLPEPNILSALPGNASGDMPATSSSRPVRRDPPRSVGHSGKQGFAVHDGNRLRGDEARARAASEHRHTMPRNTAEGEGSTDYIGTFAAGPDGVRSFQYRP